jgi:hypothetical protein
MLTAGPTTERPLRVALIWNGALQDEQLLSSPTKVMLGSSKRALFPLPDGVAEADDVTLLVPDAGGYALQPAEGMGGYVWRGGKPQAAQGLKQPLALGSGDYGLVTFGSTSVFFQQVHPVLGEAPRKSFRDGALIACLGLSVFVHVASLVFLFFVAAQELAPAAGLELDSELLRKFLIVPPPEDLVAAARKSERERAERGLRDRDEAGGKKARHEQGKVGKRDSPHAKTEIAGAPADAVAQQVRGLGLLGVLSGGHSNAVSSALDTPALDSLLGGLGSAQTVLGRGSGGLSTRGGGLGGGGNANGSLFGAGELGTGVGGGKGLGRGNGKGIGDGGRQAHEAQLSLGGDGAHVSGFLSKEQINRVVQANRAAIKYCFETALQRKPKLQGAVNAQWRIDRKGLVTTTRVAKSTLDDPGVEGCILRQIKRWKFPEPDGGEVDVVYPFLFRGQ